MILLTLHSIVRWLVIGVALATGVKFGLGWLKKHSYDSTARGLISVFGGLMDLQVVLGLAWFVLDGLSAPSSFLSGYRWAHLILMFVAAFIVHLPARWKNQEDTLRYRDSLATVAVSLLLVFIGVTILPGNRWLTITGLF